MRVLSAFVTWDAMTRADLSKRARYGRDSVACIGGAVTTAARASYPPPPASWRMTGAQVAMFPPSGAAPRPALRTAHVPPF
jgi:hypothetical protein